MWRSIITTICSNLKGTPRVCGQIWWAIYDGWEMLWNALNARPKFRSCIEHCFEKRNKSIQTCIYTRIFFCGLRGFRNCSLAWQTLTKYFRSWRTGGRKTVVIFSFNVVKTPIFNLDAVGIGFASAPLSRTARAGTSVWNSVINERSYTCNCDMEACFFSLWMTIPVLWMERFYFVVGLTCSGRASTYK